MSNSSRNIILLSILAISFLMHFKDFSKDLMSIHVWRQTQTQSTIINFYEEDMNILHPHRNDRGDSDGMFRMEFPLMQWLVACVYTVFGNHLIITRVCMFIIGLFTILGIYQLLQSLFRNTTLSLMGAWAFNFSPCFYYYTINPLPDNLALCCAVWGIAFFFIWYNNERWQHLLLSGVLLSIGALCKLPFVVYYIVPVLFFVLQVFQKKRDGKKIITAVVLFIPLILPLLWYVTVMPQWNGNMIVKGMLNNQETSNRIVEFLLHNLISTLPELLLNYGSVFFFLAGFYFLITKNAFKDFRFKLILSWSVVVLIYFLFEINAIGTAHDYYLFPLYPLLFMLVAYGAYHLYNSSIKAIRYLTLGLLLLLPFTCYLRMQSRWNADSPGFNKDLLVYKSELQNAVPKNALVVVGNDVSHFIFFYYIDKKGWGFHNDELTAEQLRLMIKKGAKYLYTDSRVTDGDVNIIQCLDKLVLERGTIKVYSLKNDRVK
ncbi:MAG: glycosyltransferase family 39 protein [Bacteroidetes bacterium]|nr:glycosyltransferase family 39 protein [Bacteroidota bacterium]